ncbi:unnamed protein product [Soboliphyme baturini]|uniref:SLC12A transporter C-terminal domain-containing protein n=1 Tax=Soboliphyme baturini TaxID=241478 RepID=A0A183IB42_9BILA|nr:unnamed protein product [Soboliphyme baturini]
MQAACRPAVRPVERPAVCIENGRRASGADQRTGQPSLRRNRREGRTAAVRWFGIRHLFGRRIGRPPSYVPSYPSVVEARLSASQHYAPLRRVLRELRDLIDEKPLKTCLRFTLGSDPAGHRESLRNYLPQLWRPAAADVLLLKVPSASSRRSAPSSRHESSRRLTEAMAVAFAFVSSSASSMSSPSSSSRLSVRSRFYSRVRGRVIGLSDVSSVCPRLHLARQSQPTARNGWFARGFTSL